MTWLSKLFHSARALQRELVRPSAAATSGFERPRLGIALGGGFARGLTHIGVLSVLEEEEIPIDYVAGTSVGAVIGAAYCTGMSAQEMREIAAMVRMRDLARWSVTRYGFWSNDRMCAFLRKLLKVESFEQLKRPLAVTATDIRSGEGVVFRSGPLVDAVRASCAYPGIFHPVSFDGRLLVDGMLSHAVPTRPLAEMGAQRVLGVYLKANWMNQNGPRHLFEVIGQCFSIAQANMCSTWQGSADHVIEPDVAGFGYDSFDRAAELITRGEEAARAAVPVLRQWLAAPVAETAKVKLSVAPVTVPAK